MTLLITHLQETPYNLSGLAREAGVNPQFLNDILKGRKPMPAQMAWDIVWALAPVIINGWTFTRDESVHALFVERKYQGGEPQESIDKGDHFEYRISVSRDVLSDTYELSQFLSA